MAETFEGDEASTKLSIYLSLLSPEASEETESKPAAKPESPKPKKAEQKKEQPKEKMSGEPSTSEGGEPKMSKAALKKAQKKAEKAAKKAASGKGPQQQAPQEDDPLADKYGDYPMVQSTSVTGRKWTRVQELTEAKAGEEVLVRARLHAVRGKGKAAFLVLRQGFYSVQATMFVGDKVSKGMVKYACNVTKESIVDITGTVNKVDEKIESTSQKDVEISVHEIHAVHTSGAVLPFQLEDAARPDAAFEEPDNQYVRVNQDTRLDHRWLDMRTPANHAIFRLQSAIGQLWREYLLQEGFVEIHTPKLIATASEGGANVFKLGYFERNAFLAQSPQLYKQMAICGDLEKVFEIGPVFRAENSNTHRHMTEFVGCDMEMEFKESYHEVLDVLENLFFYIFDNLKSRFSPELEAVRAQHPFEDLVYKRPSPRLKYWEGVKMLRDAGVEMEDLEDLSTEQEKKLGALVKEQYGTDFYILEKFPLGTRPFYTMPDPENPGYSNGYDLFIRGEEISSGAQRVHDANLLEARAKELGVDLTPIQPYVDSFKQGAPPHAGAGVGLERVVFLLLGLHNIRKSSMFPRDPQRLTP